MSGRHGAALAALTLFLANVLVPAVPAWAQAQEGARRDSPLASALALLILLLPLAVVPMVFVVAILARRTTRRNLAQIDRSLALAEENRALLRQQVASQAETNRLLGQLVERLGRD